MTDETKATHVVTVNSPGLQANFKVATDEDSNELAKGIRGKFIKAGAWMCTDPDTGAVSIISKPESAMYVVQVFEAKVYEKLASDARYAQQRQAGQQRFMDA